MVNVLLNIGWECSRANEREHGARRRVHAACVRGDSTVVAGEGRYIVLLPTVRTWVLAIGVHQHCVCSGLCAELER
jgi:hypothetical protein